MRIIKSLLRLCRLLLFAFMLAVCMVMGVAPVIPKRKEQFIIEIKLEEVKQEDDTTVTINLLEKN